MKNIQYVSHLILQSHYKLLFYLFIICIIYFMIHTTTMIYCMNDNMNIDEKPLQELVEQMRYNEDKWWEYTAAIYDRRPIEGSPQFTFVSRSDVFIMNQQLHPERYRQILEPYIETMMSKKALLNREFLQLQEKNQLLSTQIELDTISNLEGVKTIRDKILKLNSNMDSQFDKINITMQKLENKLDNLDNTMKKFKK